MLLKYSPHLDPLFMSLTSKLKLPKIFTIALMKNYLLKIYLKWVYILFFLEFLATAWI